MATCFRKTSGAQFNKTDAFHSERSVEMKPSQNVSSYSILLLRRVFMRFSFSKLVFLTVTCRGVSKPTQENIPHLKLQLFNKRRIKVDRFDPVQYL